MQLTDEQQDIVSAFDAGQHVIVQAGAGTGKTTTLIALGETARNRGMKVLYLVFNKAMQLEAEEKFRRAGLADTVTVVTMHAMAHRFLRRSGYGWVVDEMRANLRLDSTQVNDLLVAWGMNTRFSHGGVTKKPKDMYYLARGALERWMNTDETELTPDTLAKVMSGEKQKMASKTFDAFMRSIHMLAAKMWDSMFSARPGAGGGAGTAGTAGTGTASPIPGVPAHMFSGVGGAQGGAQGSVPKIPMTHDGYLKWFLLVAQGYDPMTGKKDPANYSEMTLAQLMGAAPGDFAVFFDEAQDARPGIIGFLGNQPDTQLVIVGDSAQAIYGFTGAKDALEHFSRTLNNPAQLNLSQSFRFGPEVALRANQVLEILDAPVRLRGMGGRLIDDHGNRYSQVLGFTAENEADVVDYFPFVDAVMVRGNGSCVSHSLDAYARGMSFSLSTASSKDELFAGLDELDALHGRIPDWKRKYIKDNVFSRFEDLDELLEVVQEGKGAKLRQSSHYGADALDNSDVVKVSTQYRQYQTYGPGRIKSVVNSSKVDRPPTVCGDPGFVVITTEHKTKGLEWDTVLLDVVPSDAVGRVLWSMWEARVAIEMARVDMEMERGLIFNPDTVLLDPGDTPEGELNLRHWMDETCDAGISDTDELLSVIDEWGVDAGECLCSLESVSAAEVMADLDHEITSSRMSREALMLTYVAITRAAGTLMAPAETLMTIEQMCRWIMLYRTLVPVWEQMQVDEIADEAADDEKASA